MSNERIDPERLAEFLESGLSAAERQGVLDALARDPEELAVFADAAVALEATGAPKGSAATLPFHRRRPWLVAIPMLAAAIALLVILPRGRTAGIASLHLVDGARLVDAPGDKTLAARFGPGWDEPGWSGTRGGGDPTTLPAAARAFRLGARLAELSAARGAGDGTALRSLSARVALALQAEGAAGPVAAAFRGLAASSGLPTDGRLSRIAADTRALVPAPAWFDLGVWTEAARLAVMAGGSDQLTGRLATGGRKTVASLESLQTPDAIAAASAVGRALALLEGGVAPAEREALAKVIAELMALGGR